MEPSQSNSIQGGIAITIATNLPPPPLLAIPPPPLPPPPSPTVVTPPRPSSPQVELLRCDHHKLWNCFTRRLRRYLGCLIKSSNGHPKSLEMKSSGFEKKNKVVAVTSSPVVGNVSPVRSPNYYSVMNDEEREEKLKSAIVYCKTSAT